MARFNRGGSPQIQKNACVSTAGDLHTRNENVTDGAAQVEDPIIEPWASIGVGTIVRDPAADEAIQNRDISHGVAQEDAVAISRRVRGRKGKAVQVERYMFRNEQRVW